MLVIRVRWLNDMPISLVGDLFYLFDLEELIDSLLSTESDTDSVAFATLSMPVSDEFEHTTDEDLFQIVDIVKDQTIIYTTLVAISLYIDRAVALASSLFGLQADALVQTIDYDDLPRLRQFHELFNLDPALKEAEPYI